MSRHSLEHKEYYFEERCFPRIYYLKTRLRRLVPRMKNILDFEFKNPDRGVMRMRGDDDELKNIEKDINMEIEIGCLSTSASLLSQITESEIAINAEVIVKDKKPKNRHSTEFLENNVVVVCTKFENLTETMKLLSGTEWLNHAIIAIFVDGNNVNVQTCISEDAKLKSLFSKKQVLVVTRESKVNRFQSVQEEQLKLASISSSSRQAREVSGKSQSADTQTSSPKLKGSSGRSRSPSKERRHSPRRVLSPGRTLRSSVTASERFLSPVSPRRSPMSESRPGSPMKTSNSPEASPSISPSSSPVKTRAMSASAQDSVSKRSRLDFDNTSASTAQKVQNIVCQESMEVDDYNETGKSTQEHSSETCDTQRGSWDTEELKKTVSFQLEVQVVSIIERILALLKSVKKRRDQNARVPPVSTLDKLIYEAEGLLAQSITDNGMEMKDQIEKLKLSPNVTADLLKVKGVYGCGTLYDRLNVHIEVDEANDKDSIRKEIKKVTEKYQYKDTDYDVWVVKSGPTMFGRLVICPG